MITPITYPVLLDGGSGYNALSVNDQERGDFGAFPDYDIYPDLFRVEEFGLSSWADFDYDNFSGIILTCSDNSDRVECF